MDKSAIDTPSREIDLRNIPVHLRTALRRALEFEARAPAPRSAEEAEQCEEQLRAIADEFFGALLTPVLQRAVRSAAVGDAASALVRHLPRRMRSDGRVRVRRKKRGPKTKKGRNRFHTDWKEPKLLILYVVGDDGRPSQTWAPIIDGTLRGPEAVFALLLSYARQIGLNAADKVLFIADGAPWIWRRLQRLIAALGLSPTQVLGLIDFYTALRELCRGRTAGKIRTHLNYFLKNRHRFAYTTMVGLGLPRGSGAVESAIRRVINLRIKGASIYWLPESVDAILLLRSFYKSGRWNCLQRMAMTPVGVSA